MKKEIEPLIILIILICLYLVSASTQFSCSDNKNPSSDLNEIETGKVRAINELGIGVTKTTESVFYKRVSAELLIDAKRSEVSNETPLETVELLSGNHTISFSKTNSTTTTILVDGESKDIGLKQTESAKGMYVMITDIEFVGTGAIIKFIIGTQQITLSNDQNPAQKVTFGNKSFIIEIDSASETGALIKVSKCLNSGINFEGEEASQEEKQVNRKPTPEIRTPEPNESTIQVSVAEFNARKENQSLQTNQKTEKIKSIKFFSRIWNWIKNLFGFKNIENKIVINNTAEINITNESLVNYNAERK